MPEERATGDSWGPAIIFAEPVSWPDPLIIHDPDMPIANGRGYRMSIFGGIHRDEVRHKFTRGCCHAFAAASVRLHGGHLVGLLQNYRGRDCVVHALSAHPVQGGFEVRDVCGTHSFLKDTKDLTPEDFEDLSRDHLLGTKIEEVRIVEAFPWALPCEAPTEDEIRDALSFRVCHRPLLVAEDRNGDREVSPQEMDFG